ncbi:hypothetical protein GUITHDRAFT_146423 [Guillardia theta CCMP2712]|uniref:Uncharacterized protein n=1 Tax=Guillardia theta (strain CCMP2712) TaxID=905079 RepID=L1IGY0_GUITC|nr:hypothetical protein GUITHDRAFT_146423 [Guillardia theta CCMP2712]EKX35493.1 hypothetical protein GUITHDRAFT_146423 [Guillardia theta CCMP2712]|eukprot:XP_005822473.1 hypothetical protein GUITHDRAFT_146423 [Guillardia theta CCMP2712]
MDRLENDLQQMTQQKEEQWKKEIEDWRRTIHMAASRLPVGVSKGSKSAKVDEVDQRNTSGPAQDLFLQEPQPTQRSMRDEEPQPPTGLARSGSDNGKKITRAGQGLEVAHKPDQHLDKPVRQPVGYDTQQADVSASYALQSLPNEVGRSHAANKGRSASWGPRGNAGLTYVEPTTLAPHVMPASMPMRMQPMPRWQGPPMPRNEMVMPMNGMQNSAHSSMEPQWSGGQGPLPSNFRGVGMADFMPDSVPRGGNWRMQRVPRANAPGESASAASLMHQAMQMAKMQLEIEGMLPREEQWAAAPVTGKQAKGADEILANDLKPQAQWAS